MKFNKKKCGEIEFIILPIYCSERFIAFPILSIISMFYIAITAPGGGAGAGGCPGPMCPGTSTTGSGKHNILTFYYYLVTTLPKHILILQLVRSTKYHRITVTKMVYRNNSGIVQWIILKLGRIITQGLENVHRRSMSKVKVTKTNCCEGMYSASRCS